MQSYRSEKNSLRKELRRKINENPQKYIPHEYLGLLNNDSISSNNIILQHEFSYYFLHKLENILSHMKKHKNNRDYVETHHKFFKKKWFYLCRGTLHG
jgi:hypothetical protein